MSDDLFAHRLRCGIAAYLWDCGGADFTVLATALETPNNLLSAHLARLEKAGVVELKRGFLGRRPRTVAVLTAEGRRAWAAYLDQR